MKAEIVENKYRKVLIATQRAKQIKRGAQPLVNLPGAKAIRVALAEVGQGLIAFEVEGASEESGNGIIAFEVAEALKPA